MLKTVHLLLDPLNNAEMETVEVEDLVPYLRSRWAQFPDTGRIYHEVVSVDHDVTPHSEAECERLRTLPGPFYVVTFPGYNLAVQFIVAIVVAAAVYILTPTPKVPLLPNAAQRNQQSSSPNNELSQRTNRARINERIPDIFGKVRATMDLLSTPYRVFENNVEVEYAYMCIGRGQYEIFDCRDGETQISNIPGAGAVVYGPFQSPNNTETPTEPVFGNYFHQPVLNAKRSNSVNGQVLRPPNAQTFVANGNVRFRYPNVIEMPSGNSQDFTKFFVNGDGIIISGASMNSGDSVTENIECIVTNGEFRVTLLYGRTPVPLTYGAHVGLVLPAGNEDVRALFTPGAQVVLTQTSGGISLTGTYTIATAVVTRPVNVSNGLPNPNTALYEVQYLIVDFVDPAAVNPNWDDIAPLNLAHGSDGWDYITELETRTFQCALDATGSYDLDLDDTYTIVSVTQWQIILDNPGLVNADWATIHSHGDVTPYLSPTITTTEASRWVGPFVITKDDTTRVLANFVAVNGLYKDNGTDQTAANVDIELEIASVDADDEPTGPTETFRVTMIGSSTLKETIAQTISAQLASFYGRLQVRARRSSETDEVFEGTVVDEVRWRDVYAVSSVGETDFGNVTTVQTKTYATASALAAKERQLNMLVQRKIPARVGDTENFTDNALVATSRADAIIMAVCRDKYIGGRSVDDIDVDNIYDTIQAVQSYFGSASAVEFSYTFDNDNLSFEETLGVLADAVFCTAYRRGSEIQLSFERLTTDATILFNHRNKLPGSEKRTFTFGVLEENDGVEYTYVNPTDDSLISVFLPENSSPGNPKKVESVGVRNHLQAYFHTWRIWNKMRYSNITTEFDATQEALLLVKSDRFLCTDSTRAGSQDGEVVGVAGLTLTLSQNVSLTADPPYTIFLQLYDGTTQAIGVTVGSAANQVTLAEAPNLALVTEPGKYARTAYMIAGDDDPRQLAFLLTERSANDGMISTVKGINYDPRYYANDDAFINNEIDENGYGPTGGYTPPDPGDPVYELPPPPPNSGAVKIALNSRNGLYADGKYYNGTGSVYQDPFLGGGGFPPPFEFFASTLDDVQLEMRIGFDYNGGLYDGPEAGLYAIPPYPVAITRNSWRSYGGTSGGFLLKNIDNAIRVDAVRVVLNSAQLSSNHPFANVTIDGDTKLLSASTEDTPDTHVGEWLLPTVDEDGVIEITWAATSPGDNIFQFVLIEILYTLVGPYLLHVNSAIPVENGSTSVPLQGRHLETATSLTIDGVSQTLVDGATPYLRFNLVRGGLKYAAHVMTATDGFHESSAAVSVVPQNGWNVIDIATPYADDELRVSSTPDIASGDQIAYDNLLGAMLVNADATVVYYGSMPAEIPAEIWSDGDWTTGSILLAAGSGNEDL